MTQVKLYSPAIVIFVWAVLIMIFGTPSDEATVVGLVVFGFALLFHINEEYHENYHH